MYNPLKYEIRMYYFWLGFDTEFFHEIEAQWKREEKWEGDFTRLW